VSALAASLGRGSKVGHAELGGVVSGHDLVHRAQLLFGRGESGFEPGDLAGPALALGLCDAGLQVVAGLDEAFPLVRIRP
jgi:hypothetical protein